MFQRGTGERFKYKQAVLEKYPNAVSKSRKVFNQKWYAIHDGDKRISKDVHRRAEDAWSDVYCKMMNEEI